MLAAECRNLRKRYDGKKRAVDALHGLDPEVGSAVRTKNTKSGWAVSCDRAQSKSYVGAMVAGAKRLRSQRLDIGCKVARR